MTITPTGNGFRSGANAGSGIGGTGTLTLSGGTYTFGSFNTGGSFNASVATVAVGVTLLTGGVDVTVARPSDSETVQFYGNVRVGFASNPNDVGLGVMVVEGGSTLTIQNTTVEGLDNGEPTLLGGYGNLRIGRFKGGDGLVRVTGAGSQIEALGGAARIDIGREDGTGVLRIDNGGAVHSLSLVAGRSQIGSDQVSTGTVIVDGVGSELVLSTDYGTFLPISDSAGDCFWDASRAGAAT